MDTPRSHDDHVGVSPNWYCSGAGREDELKLELSSFQARVARLEGQLKEKDSELDEAREALSHERRLEIESLHNMKTGSEKIIEQKSQQVQQLHGAVQKLNEALRKKDQQLHTVVSQNLRSDGAYTEASADLTESRLSLKHAEADLTKERVTLQRLEVQMTSVASQNQRLEELVQQYRLELQRKDAALNATLAKEDGQDRLRHRSALEAAESLGEASTHLARLEHELNGQEANLLSSISGPVRCYPSVTQPGKRVKITVQSHSADPPKMTSASNAHDVADMRAVPSDDGEYAHRFESSFVAGQRAGVALVSFCLSTPNGLPVVAQAVALVEDAGRTSDLSGTTFATRHPRCHLACDMEVLITPRNAMGELVQVSLASEPLPPHASPQRNSSASEAAFEPTVQVSGADVVSHARRLTDHTYRIVVRPSAAAMTISFTDNTGILASTTIGVDSPTPDHTRTVVEAPDSVTVGDRGTLQVKLFDSLGFPCPAGAAPSQLLNVSAGAGPASDATDVSDDIVELGYGVYGIHFVPLAIGTSVLNVAVGKAQERVFTARVHVAGAGGAASLDRFVVRLDPPSGCVPFGSRVKATVSFSDALGLPATSAPPVGTLSVSFDKQFVFERPLDVGPDPHTPGCLSFSFLSVGTGTCTMSIACRGGGTQTTSLCSTGGADTGAYDGLSLAVKPSILPPGGVFSLIATPVDGVGNTLRDFPVAHGYVAELSSCDEPEELRVQTGGHAVARMTCPLAPGKYTVSVGTHAVAVEVSSDVVVASRHVGNCTRSVLQRLPLMAQFTEVLEGAYRACRVEASEAQQQAMRMKTKEADLRGLHREELAAVREAGELEKEALHGRIGEMKKKLAEERSEQDDLQQRWDEREAAIERERAVHVEDRRLWMEERNRLTQQDEENTSVIASLRQQVAELQAKLKQLQAASERRSAEQEDAFTQRITADRRRADADVASAEARCQAALEMAEEHKAAAEFEHQRVEQHLVRIEELDQVLLSMKTTMHEIGQQRLQLEDRVARMDGERTESLRQHERRVEEVTRKHHHTVTLLKQTHIEEVETLRREATDAHARAERRVETLTADVESRKATFEAQASQERVRVAQEQDELRQHAEEVQAKLRAAQRELQAETEAREAQAQAWDTQRRALERRAAEAAQAAREVEQRAAAEVDSLQLAAEHDRQAWGREHAALLERATQQREDWDEQRALLEERLAAASAQHHAAAQQWEAARGEAAAAHARQREKLEEAVRQAGAQLEEEKGANEDERRVWMTERTDLKARANHLQLQLDETQRKASRVTDEMYDELALEREEWTQRCSELERELHEARKAAVDAAAKQKVEMAALKTSLEERRQEFTARIAALEAAAKQGEEELAAEKRRATRDAQMLNEDFEVEREKFRLKAVGTQQQLENQRAELEEVHERHAMKLAEVEAERLRYVAEQSQLREKLVQLEAEASALAEEHKAQLAEGDRMLAKARKEAEAALQAQAAQLEAQFLQRLEGDVQALEDARRVAEQEWKEELVRQADALRAELARVQAASAEREGIQERFLDEARENFNEEISKLEAQLAKAKAEKLAVRQKAEEERAEERRRARAEQQEVAEEHARARTAWEEEQDRLLRAQDETRAAHQRELNEKNRQLQRAGLEEAEAQHEEARREMVALREAWQTQLAITSEAHDKDRAAFAREREEWRAERARLWSERNASKQQLEAALAATDDVRDTAENAAARRTDEVATLAERVAELEHQRDELARQGEERAAADHALLVAGRQEWVQEKGELHAALEEARVAEERLRAERTEASRDLEEAGRRAGEAEAEAARRARKEGGELRVELEAARGSVASLQREVARATKEGDELRRRLGDGADRARQDMEALRGEQEEAALRTRRESEAAAEALGLTKRTLAEAEAQLERAREEAQAERVRGREEYEELTASHAELQRRYAERMQSSATEARELRARGSEVDARWRDKEAELTKALTAAKELAGQERSAYERRLESVMASMEEQMAEKSSELRSLHLQLQDAQGDAEQVWQERVRVERSLKERLDSEKRVEHERQQASGQLANYKRLLSEVQDKRDTDATAAASERAEWKAERARARDEADALKRQIQVCITTTKPSAHASYTPLPLPRDRTWRALFSRRWAATLPTATTAAPARRGRRSASTQRRRTGGRWRTSRRACGTWARRSRRRCARRAVWRRSRSTAWRRRSAACAAPRSRRTRGRRSWSGAWRS